MHTIGVLAGVRCRKGNAGLQKQNPAFGAGSAIYGVERGLLYGHPDTVRTSDPDQKTADEDKDRFRSLGSTDGGWQQQLLASTASILTQSSAREKAGFSDRSEVSFVYPHLILEIFTDRAESAYDRGSTTGSAECGLPGVRCRKGNAGLQKQNPAEESGVCNLRSRKGDCYMVILMLFVLLILIRNRRTKIKIDLDL